MVAEIQQVNITQIKNNYYGEIHLNLKKLLAAGFLISFKSKFKL